MNRAATYARRLGALDADRPVLRERLELWYLRTRFAYRVPLERVVDALAHHPGGAVQWHGGPSGGWREDGAERS